MASAQRWLAVGLLGTVGFVALVALGGFASAAAPANISGVWKTETSDYFSITQDPGAAAFDSAVTTDACTSGPRTFVIQGTLDGVSMNGTMSRCSDVNDSLVKKCHVPAIWQTPFSANLTDAGIVGEYRGEFWKWNETSNGSWVDCHLDHYTTNSFELDRLDCRILGFEELAEKYIADPAARPAEVALAERAEAGETVLWTAGQLAPDGLKAKAEQFIQNMIPWGYHGTIVSAYRPLLYQAHFANLRLCGLALAESLAENPGSGPALKAAVDVLDRQVGRPGHRILHATVEVEGLSVFIAFVCYKDPISQCGHTDERAVDITFGNDDDPALDGFGAFSGFCRPYLKTETVDIVHWEWFGDVFAAAKCNSVGTGPGDADIHLEGDSPVNLLLEDSSGRRVGYDAAAGRSVNTFGPAYAFYSGPGTEPQVIELFGGATQAGLYKVTGVGTGSGPYTVTLEVLDRGEGIVEKVTGGGVAAQGAPIASVNYTMRDNYSSPSPWVLAPPKTPGGTTFEVRQGAGSAEVAVAGGGVSAAIYNSSGNILGFKGDGTAGASTVTVPKGLIGGPFTVRADGVPVAATATEGPDGTTLAFERPAGAAIITVQGSAPAAGPPPAAGGTPVWLVSAVGAAAVAGAVAFLWMRRRKASPPT